MTRENLIKTVSDGLAMLVHLLEGRTAARLTDLNVVSENFVKDFLNDLRDLELRNLNADRQNQPAIDLGDKTRRVSYQVSTEYRTHDIQKKLDKFFTHNLDRDYDQIS